MCFNRKVLAGLAAVAAGILLFQPRLIGSALPLLVAAACPLGMIVMMRGMSGAANRCQTGTKAADPIDTSAEIARLRAEVARLRGEPGEQAPTPAQPRPPPGAPRS